MGEDGARGKDLLRARGHHLCLTDTIFLVFIKNPNLTNKILAGGKGRGWGVARVSDMFFKRIQV